MKCPQCNTEVQPNYNFCPKCRFDMRTLKSESKSAPKSQPKTAPKAESSEAVSEKVELDLVKNKAIWKVAPGELARRISEKEIAQIDNLRGIVIQEGVTAYIYLNGEEVAQLDGGSYTFLADSEIKEAVKEKETKQKEEDDKASFVKKAWRGLLKLVTSKKKQEKQKKEKRRMNREEVVKRLSKNTLIEVCLKQNRDFVATFGQKDVNGEPEFMPIRTQNVDAGIALQLNMRITDFKSFIAQYLTDRKFVTAQIIQSELMPWVKSIVTRVMRDNAIDEMGITDSAREEIEARLESLNDELHGLTITKLIDITSRNEDFERLRELSQQQYMANKELDFLVRSHEFENRLASVNNAHTVQEAANDRDLMFALDEINKDKLLHEDELDKFYVLLSRQKRLRDAKDDADEARIMNEIRGTQLLSDDQLAEIEHNLAMKAEGRENVAELLRIRGLFDQDKARLTGEMELDDMQRAHAHKTTLEDADLESEMLDKGLSKQRRVDEYGDERDDVELQKRVKAAEAQRELDKRLSEDHLDELQKKQDMSLSAMERLKQMEAAEAAQKHQQELERQQQQLEHELEQARLKHEEEMAQKANEREMSAQQIMASKIAQMGGDAANTFAQSFSSENALEAQKTVADERAAMMEKQQEMYERMMAQQAAQQQSMMENMMGFANQGLKTAADIAASRTAEAKEQKEEYRQQMQHEQQRVDATQDKALNYTTRVTEAQVQSQQASKGPKTYKIASMGGVEFNIDQIKPLVAAGAITARTIIEIDGEKTFAEDCPDLEFLFATAAPAAPVSNQVKCPHCGEMVDKGRWCPVCGNEL